jgi:predicted small secreted protein
MLKKLVLLITLLILIGLLAGCQTVQGLGKDIEWTGQKGAEAISGE